MSEQDPGQPEAQQVDAQFAMQRLYLKDSSFESPRAPDIFRGNNWKPKVNLELNTRSAQVEEGLFEVVLSLTATTRDENDEVVYLVEIQQAGIFMIRGIEGDPLARMLGTLCPSVLFPYARETIDSIVTKGSFPPLMLAPVNFEAIYDQARAQQAGQQPTIQ